MQPASDAFLATDSNQSMRYSLLDDIQEFIGLAWSALVMLVGLVSVILLLVTVQLDGDLDGDFLNRQWTGRFAPLVLTLFILAVYPRLRRQYMNAINAFRYLLVREETTFEQMVAEMAPLNRRHELMAAGIGVIMGWGINNPLIASPQWTQIYSMALNGLIFGLIAWLMYAAFAGTRLFSYLHEYELSINIFKMDGLEPIAGWGLGISLTFVGLITLSLPFVRRQDLRTPAAISLYALFLLISVAVFFFIIRSTHFAMKKVKDRELEAVRDHLTVLYRQLKDVSDSGTLEDAEALSDSVSAWLNYEHRIKIAPEWPYNTDQLRNLSLSILFPIALGVVQVFLEAWL